MNECQVPHGFLAICVKSKQSTFANAARLEFGSVLADTNGLMLPRRCSHVAGGAFKSAKTMMPAPVCKRLKTLTLTCWPIMLCALLMTTMVPSLR